MCDPFVLDFGDGKIGVTPLGCTEIPMLLLTDQSKHERAGDLDYREEVSLSELEEMIHLGALRFKNVKSLDNLIMSLLSLRTEMRKPTE